MNVIFLDFDGVLNSFHFHSDEDYERRIKILSDICHEYDSKVVIEASAKFCIDEDTMETEIEWIKKLFSFFKKYDIDVIGRTPSVEKDNVSIWKEDEILLYLSRHPEIEHYCVIDDDDLQPHNSDLNKVRDHLVTTLWYSHDPDEEGLLEKHKLQVGEILKKDNKIKRKAL